jgi:hypothetical protein
MKVSELIENWKKQREEISKWPWEIETTSDKEEAGYRKWDVIHNGSGKHIFDGEIALLNEGSRNSKFIASAPETIEALTKALEDVADLLREYKNLDDELREDCRHDYDSQGADIWLKKHGFVK